MNIIFINVVFEVTQLGCNTVRAKMFLQLGGYGLSKANNVVNQILCLLL